MTLNKKIRVQQRFDPFLNDNNGLKLVKMCTSGLRHFHLIRHKKILTHILNYNNMERTLSYVTSQQSQ